MIRRKRGDTRAGTIECIYRVDFGVRSDMKVDKLMKKWRVTSVTALIRKYWQRRRHRERYISGRWEHTKRSYHGPTSMAETKAGGIRTKNFSKRSRVCAEDFLPHLNEITNERPY